MESRLNKKNEAAGSHLPLPPHEQLARIRLYRSENIGPILFHQLLQRYQTAENALQALPELTQQSGRKTLLRIYTEDQATKELEKHKKYKADLVVWGDPLYPEALRKIPDASPVLSLKGHASLMNKKMVAMVGARNCSLIGKKIAATLAQDLGNHGYVIVSGLARGIDTTAHQRSLSTGTIAVIAGGIDQIYPLENEKLYHCIGESGLIIAEAPFGREPQATLFPRRNRLISGLSLGAIIIEAALQSGSLITARYANDQGKEVFVVPGSPLDPRYKGSHQLLKQGATLITSSHDVMDVLDRPFGLSILSTEEAAFSPLPQADLDDKTREALTKIILSLLSPTAISLDELIRECRVSSAEILGVLLPLELAGIVVRYPGNYVARAA